jgi:hypothetical protein
MQPPTTNLLIIDVSVGFFEDNSNLIEDDKVDDPS